MKKTLLFSLMLLGSSAALAKSTACPVPTLKNFAVYSASDLDVQQSDYTGPAGAAGSVIASHFEFNASSSNCLALAAGGSINLGNAAVKGSIESRDLIRLYRVGVDASLSSKTAEITSSSIGGALATIQKPRVSNSGAVRTSTKPSFVVPHDALITELRRTSETLSRMTSTIQPIPQSADTVALQAGPGLNVVTLTSTQIDAVNTIAISGVLGSKLIINVPGARVSLAHKMVSLDGQIRPQDITWNFYESTDVQIIHTANPTLGLPGTVFAPVALVEFNEGLITGALYAGKIVTSIQGGGGSLNAGQVNYEAPGDQPGCPTPAPIPPAFPE